MFTSLSALPKEIRYAAQKFSVPFYTTGNHFDGQAAYRFYQRSIMANDVLHYQKLLLKGKPVFNNLQNHVMRTKAKRAIK